MKVRMGFVSNSSSSSFVIGVKGELTADKIMKVFNVDEKSPLHGVAAEMASLLVDRAEEVSMKEMLDDGYLSEDVIKQLIRKDFTLYKGNICSDGEPVECALCEAVGLDYEDDEIYINKEAGY